MTTRSHLEQTPCIICGIDDSETIWAMDSFGFGESVLRRCKRCGLLYYSPRLNEYTLRAIYSGTSEHYDYGESLAQHRYAIRRAERCVRLIRRFYRQEIGTPLRLLDVGCGYGFYLQVAKAHGFEAIGIEPAEPVAKFASERFGLDVIASDFESAQLDDGSFDVLMMHHVLEHLRNPKMALRKAKKLLKDNGLLIISVPNAASMPAKLAGREWVYFGELHLYHFTPMTIQRLLGFCGFKVVHMETHHGYILWDAPRIAANALRKLGMRHGGMQFRGKGVRSTSKRALRWAFRFFAIFVWMPIAPFVWLLYCLGFGPDLWVCARAVCES